MSALPEPPEEQHWELVSNEGAASISPPAYIIGSQCSNAVSTVSAILLQRLPGQLITLAMATLFGVDGLAAHPINDHDAAGECEDHDSPILPSPRDLPQGPWALSYAPDLLTTALVQGLHASASKLYGCCGDISQHERDLEQFLLEKFFFNYPGPVRNAIAAAASKLKNAAPTVEGLAREAWADAVLRVEVELLQDFPARGHSTGQRVEAFCLLKKVVEMQALLSLDDTACQAAAVIGSVTKLMAQKFGQNEAVGNAEWFAQLAAAGRDPIWQLSMEGLMHMLPYSLHVDSAREVMEAKVERLVAKWLERSDGDLRMEAVQLATYIDQQPGAGLIRAVQGTLVVAFFRLLLAALRHRDPLHCMEGAEKAVQGLLASAVPEMCRGDSHVAQELKELLMELVRCLGGIAAGSALLEWVPGGTNSQHAAAAAGSAAATTPSGMESLPADGLPNVLLHTPETGSSPATSQPAASDPSLSIYSVGTAAIGADSAAAACTAPSGSSTAATFDGFTRHVVASPGFMKDCATVAAAVRLLHRLADSFFPGLQAVGEALLEADAGDGRMHPLMAVAVEPVAAMLQGGDECSGKLTVLLRLVERVAEACPGKALCQRLVARLLEKAPLLHGLRTPALSILTALVGHLAAALEGGQVPVSGAADPQLLATCDLWLLECLLRCLLTAPLGAEECSVIEALTRLLTYLLDKRLITPKQLAEAQAPAGSSGGSPLQYLGCLRYDIAAPTDAAAGGWCCNLLSHLMAELSGRLPSGAQEPGIEAAYEAVCLLFQRLVQDPGACCRMWASKVVDEVAVVLQHADACQFSPALLDVLHGLATTAPNGADHLRRLQRALPRLSQLLVLLATHQDAASIAAESQAGANVMRASNGFSRCWLEVDNAAALLKCVNAMACVAEGSGWWPCGNCKQVERLLDALLRKLLAGPSSALMRAAARLLPHLLEASPPDGALSKLLLPLELLRATAICAAAAVADAPPGLLDTGSPADEEAPRFAAVFGALAALSDSGCSGHAAASAERLTEALLQLLGAVSECTAASGGFLPLLEQVVAWLEPSPGVAGAAADGAGAEVQGRPLADRPDLEVTLLLAVMQHGATGPNLVGPAPEESSSCRPTHQSVRARAASACLARLLPRLRLGAGGAGGGGAACEALPLGHQKAVTQVVALRAAECLAGVVLAGQAPGEGDDVMRGAWALNGQQAGVALACLAVLLSHAEEAGTDARIGLLAEGCGVSAATAAGALLRLLDWACPAAASQEWGEHAPVRQHMAALGLLLLAAEGADAEAIREAAINVTGPDSLDTLLPRVLRAPAAMSTDATTPEAHPANGAAPRWAQPPGRLRDAAQGAAPRLLQLLVGSGLDALLLLEWQMQHECPSVEHAIAGAAMEAARRRRTSRASRPLTTAAAMARPASVDSAGMHIAAGAASFHQVQPEEAGSAAGSCGARSPQEVQTEETSMASGETCLQQAQAEEADTAAGSGPASCQQVQAGEMTTVCSQLVQTEEITTMCSQQVQTEHAGHSSGCNSAGTGVQGPETRLGAGPGRAGPVMRGEHLEEVALSRAIPTHRYILGHNYGGFDYSLGQPAANSNGRPTVPRLVGHTYRTAHHSVRLTRAEFKVVLKRPGATAAPSIQFTAWLYTTSDDSGRFTADNAALVASAAAPSLAVSAISTSRDTAGNKVAFEFDDADPGWALQPERHYFLGVSSDDAVFSSVMVPCGASMWSSGMISGGHGHQPVRVGAVVPPPLVRCGGVVYRRHATGEWLRKPGHVLHMDVYGVVAR